MILCSETMLMWTMNNYNEIRRSGFERMTSGITSVISLKFCTTGFELTYENSTKPIKKNSLLFKKTPHDGAIRQKQQALLRERERERERESKSESKRGAG